MAKSLCMWRSPTVSPNLPDLTALPSARSSRTRSSGRDRCDGHSSTTFFSPLTGYPIAEYRTPDSSISEISGSVRYRSTLCPSPSGKPTATR